MTDAPRPTAVPAAGSSSTQAPGGPSRRVTVDVRHECDVSAVISATMRLCTTHHLSPVFAAHVATAASELANNLWMHASRGGQVHLETIAQGGRRGVELVAEDDGPGIVDIALALSEGYSTGGGMGCGLPGVKRLMDDFEITSQADRGTRVLTRKWLPLRT